ncbi:MAG: hypothetical protein ACRDRK_22250 [Pseudonocardia sp.]
MVAAVRHALIEQTEASTGTRGRLRRRTVALLAEEHGTQVAAAVMPSSATFYRLVDRLAGGAHAFGAATTRRSLARPPTRPFGRLRALRPGEWVQIDTSPLDVMVVLDNGLTERVELTIMVDVATRTICTGILRPKGTKAVDAALLLARTVVPEPMRPGWPDALRMRASRLPHEQLIAADERLERAAALPVIVPETIVSDRGAVFVSQTFLDACTRLGISLHPARPDVPTDKPTVERTFSSIGTLFAQYVAGYTGRDVTRRGAHVAEDAVWTLPQLQELFDQWVIAGWQPRPHDGLRVPELPRAALSPNEMYGALVAAAGYLPVALTGSDYLELLPVAWRRITDTGIELDVLTYDDAALNALRGRPSGVTARGGRRPIHHDPYDRGQVWVRGPDTGDWLEVPWVYRGLVQVPFAEFTVRHVRAQVAARGERSDDQLALATALHALLDRATGPAPAGQQDRRSRRVRGRTHAAGPSLPGGQGEHHDASDTAASDPDGPDGPDVGDGGDEVPGTADIAGGDVAAPAAGEDHASTSVAPFELFNAQVEAERDW